MARCRICWPRSCSGTPAFRSSWWRPAGQVNLVEEGIDLALRAGKLDDSTLVARKVAVTELGLYASPAYLERRGVPRRVGDLAGHDSLLLLIEGGPPALAPHRPARHRAAHRHWLDRHR